MDIMIICLVAATISVGLNTIIPYILKIRESYETFDIKYIYAAIITIFATYILLLDTEITSPLTMFVVAFLSAGGINIGTKFGVKQMNVAEEMSAKKK